MAGAHDKLLEVPAVPKDEEIVVDRPHELSDSTHDIAFYERQLMKAFSESRRILCPDGIGVIVFASKTTASWEAVLRAVIDAGLVVTGSWPIDTEREARIAAQGQARLGSSVHIVCRPREHPDGSLLVNDVGDWRSVLQELPKKIHEWMPRLADEGVVGADAIFSCLGPALEIFSQYSKVEKASGEVVSLKEYLEQVWAAVSKEALNMIFQGADASGFEEDARITAMWLWTLHTSDEEFASEEEEDDADDSEDKKKARKAGFALEYDAARKIAQGLGAHLEAMPSVVAVEGETAILLPVAARAKFLFGGDQPDNAATSKKVSKKRQLDLFEEMKLPTEDEMQERKFGTEVMARGKTTLDRIHQAMILFASGRGEAMKRMLVDDGAGKNPLFWRLAQSLAALYPPGTEEKRWVEGLLARKKGLGL